MGTIYGIINTQNGKIYVGQTRQPLAKRWALHISRAEKKYRTRLYCSMGKYGTEAFWIFTIEVVDNDRLNERESFWIGALDSANPAKGYNMTLGGDVKTPNEEVRRKLSAIARARPRRPHSEATKAKIRASKLGKPRDRATIEKLRKARQGKRLSPEWKAKIRESLRKRASLQRKLSDSQIAEVEQMLYTHSDLELSRLWGVSRKTIWRIRKANSTNLV